MTVEFNERKRSRGRWRRLIAAVLAAVVLLLVVAWFTLTASTPDVDDRPPPTAQQVGAARYALNQLKASRRDPGGRHRIDLDRAQLDGMAALASYGFRPDRLAIELRDETAVVRGSHRLPGGRWLNAGLKMAGGGSGFPPVRLRVGDVTLGPSVSRLVVRAGRLLLRLRGIDLPPLDRAVSQVTIGSDAMMATISLPNRTRLVDGLTGITAQPIDTRNVVDIYCRLTRLQNRQPVTTLPELIHRVVTPTGSGAAASERNRAAMVALAMLVVDDRVGDLAGTARIESGRCRVPPVSVTLHDRPDWAKHWTLSAALAAGAGTQLSEAMGEWKELADGLDPQSTFAVGDPSGFSFADLAADRSGFRIARGAASADRAVDVAAWLRTVTAEQLLPHVLTADDGITNAEFVRRFGSLSDPRFAARRDEIDRTLDQAGQRAIIER